MVADLQETVTDKSAEIAAKKNKPKVQKNEDEKIAYSL